MNKSLSMKKECAILLSSILFFTACHSSYEIIGIEGGKIEMTSAFDKNPDRNAISILAPYTVKVDSVMSPVVGYSAEGMKAGRPESLLSNLVADILRQAASKYEKAPIDVSVVNIGGLRSDLPKGAITYGDVYEILPFENTLSILTLSGKSLIYLFQNLAKAGGEGLSGARLVIDSNGKLIDATVGGKKINENKLYKVATVDYLAEGNDGMPAFLQAEENICPAGATLRQLFLNYVIEQNKKGKSLDSHLDGRISMIKRLND